MAVTPECAVKKEIIKWLHDKGFIRAGSKEKNWPLDIKGWYYMPVQTGFGVNGIPDFVCCWNGKFLSIEAKALGLLTNTAANQDARINEIRLAKGLAVVVDDVSLLDELLGDL